MKITKTPLAGILVAGLIASSAIAQQADTTKAAEKAAAKEVGIASSDGITLSGTDVLVTRNGVTEKLTKEITIGEGIRVKPDGTILSADGGTLTLRPAQIRTFDGKFVNSTPPVAAPITKEVTEHRVEKTTSEGSQAISESAAKAADAEAQRRAQAAAAENGGK